PPFTPAIDLPMQPNPIRLIVKNFRDHILSLNGERGFERTKKALASGGLFKSFGQTLRKHKPSTALIINARLWPL
ncbi:MAG: hypothetical protein AAB779_02835, partial [Patescibacteria group bacterium]